MRNKFYPRACQAFTLTEILIALGLTTLAAVVFLSGVVQINKFAYANRLNTCAFDILQARADKVFCVRPFTPVNGSDPFITSGTNPLPQSVMLCGSNTVTLGTPCVETINIILDSDALVASGTIQAVVTGTLTTLVQNASILTGGSASSSGTVQLRSVNMNLNYQYRGQSYNVQMTCLRAPDV